MKDAAAGCSMSANQKRRIPASILKKSIGKFVQHLRDQGRAIVLIEHDLTTVFSLCDRLIVLDRGALIADGAPDEVKRHPSVIAAYLGIRGAQTQVQPTGVEAEDADRR